MSHDPNRQPTEFHVVVDDRYGKQIWIGPFGLREHAESARERFAAPLTNGGEAACVLETIVGACPAQSPSPNFATGGFVPPLRTVVKDFTRLREDEIRRIVRDEIRDAARRAAGLSVTKVWRTGGAIGISHH